MNGNSTVFRENEKKLRSRTPSELRRLVGELLRQNGNRFSFAMGFLFCAVSVAMWYLLFYAATYFFDGRDFPYHSDSFYLFFSVISFTVPAVLSLPLFHGFSCMAADCIRTGNADLRRMFLPFSSLRLFLSSLVFSLAAALTWLLPAAVYCILEYYFFADTAWEFLLWFSAAFLGLPLYLLLCAPLRRMARMHAVVPERGFLGVVRLAHRAPRQSRRTHRALFFAFVPEFLLALVTLLISGVYRTFGGWALASALQTSDTVNQCDSRKDK